jgi:hypothetical protein
MLDFREIGWGGTCWIDLAQDRALVNAVMNVRVSQDAGKLFCSCITIGISKRAQL